MNRGGRTGRELTNGPSKLCVALAIDFDLNGHDISRPPLRLLLGPALPSEQIVVAKRVGITKGVDLLRRFYIRDNPYISKR
ncbi:3-methyladenine DNA glycosylase [compost metagenome]